IEALQQDDEQGRAYNRALFYLGFRPRSRTEIEKYLTEKAYPAHVIEAVVQRLIEQKYLDDETFARLWVEGRERSRPSSARALRYELRQKGVDRTVIEEVLDDVDDEAAAWAALEPKLARWQALEQADFVKKATGFLARRGFGYDITRRACKRAWSTLASEQEVDSAIFDSE
ncbi:MAG: RecX family transcriptional regulator, partial [Chloroflexota bacterium]|nr:RecX family transcriptional regulator [Chloroflexota bacterium]